MACCVIFGRPKALPVTSNASDALVSMMPAPRQRGGLLHLPNAGTQFAFVRLRRYRYRSASSASVKYRVRLREIVSIGSPTSAVGNGCLDQPFAYGLLAMLFISLSGISDPISMSM